MTEAPDRLDILVVVFYFVLVLAVGLLFRNEVRKASDYFRASGKMLWWMSGASAFMTTFSAWTFTGAASKAYSDGLAVSLIFIANAAAYVICALFFAAKFRQTRVDTPLQAYARRFGPMNEQIKLWLGFFVSQIPAAITLVAVSVIVSAIFGWNLQSTIIVTGATVVVITLTGGAWAVIASDFVQAMLIFSLSVVAGLHAIQHVGSVAEIIDRFPAESIWLGDSIHVSWVFVLWAIALTVQRMVDINNLDASVRFLAAKDSSHARRAALLAAGLFGVSALIWFLPPMASASVLPSLDQVYPNVSNPSETAYLAYVDQLMPVGTLGLMCAAMFAATMSSIDSSLNGGAAMVVRCFYARYLRPKAADTELLAAGRITTLIIGAGQVSIALYVSQLSDVDLFGAMLSVLGLFIVPMVIPGLLSMFVRRVPDWSAWSTVLVGFAVSWLTTYVVNGEFVAAMLGVGLNSAEIASLDLACTYCGHLVITVGWFLSTRLWYRPLPVKRQSDVDEFYRRLESPIAGGQGDDDVEIDALQRRRLGTVTIVFAVFVFGLRFGASDPGRDLVFFGIGGILMLIGVGLLYAGRGVGQTHRTEWKLSE